MANTKYFNGVELGALGLQVGGISGVHDLLPMEVSRTWIAGRDYPSDVETHRSLGKIALRCVVAEADHATLVTKLQTLRNYMSPALGWCDFRLSERPNERCLARSLGFGIDIADIPWDRNVIEWVWNLERYPWWEDATAQTTTVAPQLMAFRQATFEHSVLADCGWEALNAGTPSVVTTDPYAGGYCMQVVTAGGNMEGAKTLAAGIAGITAGQVYSLGAWLKGDAVAAAYGVTLAIEWLNAAGATLNASTGTVLPPATWALYKMENKTAPANAVKARIWLFGPNLHVVTFYADQVSLTQAATVPAVYVTPYDANTSIYNAGTLDAYPTYTCTATAALAGGLTFTVNGVTFTYSGALAPADVLTVETDVAEVKLNGTRDFAHVAAAAEFPLLAPGANTVTAKTTGFTLLATWRGRKP